jgi:hypothetical protein
MPLLLHTSPAFNPADDVGVSCIFNVPLKNISVTVLLPIVVVFEP